MEPISVIIWRFVRGAVASAIAQTVVIQIDWTNPDLAVRTLIAAFVSGFLLALSKALRNSDMSKNTPIVEKLPI